jgi:hypothetical protein
MAFLGGAVRHRLNDGLDLLEMSLSSCVPSRVEAVIGSGGRRTSCRRLHSQNRTGDRATARRDEGETVVAGADRAGSSLLGNQNSLWRQIFPCD